VLVVEPLLVSELVSELVSLELLPVLLSLLPVLDEPPLCPAAAVTAAPASNNPAPQVVVVQ
jgi:hypothetical protein